MGSIGTILNWHHQRGFWRITVCRIRFALINTRKHREVYSDRTYGTHLGRYIVNVSRV